MRVRARLLALITAAALTGLLGPGASPAAAVEESSAPSDVPAASAAGSASAATTTPTEAAGSTAAAESSENGPAEGPSSVQPSTDQATGGPNQETGSSAGSTIGNNGTIGQSSGQGQDAGNGNGQNGNGNGQIGNGNGQGNQQAQTGQQADAGSHAAAENPQNESNGVRVGNGNGNANGHDNGNANGNGNGVGQQSSTGAEATATTSQETNQDPGNGVNQASGTQGASAAAHSEADRPSNDIVNTRIEADGDDHGFAQSITSDARAEAANDRAEGNEIAQEARATAVAELRQPENAAVEVRLFSDGDTTGGIQTIAATAAALVENGGPDAAANATATVTDPANTFVSLRVNSEGTTGDVTQEILRQELEVVDGESIERAVRDLLDRIWSGIDLGSGVSISLATDGANTDLRITIDNDSLLRPSAGTTFFWTWDLVFGPGGQLDCTLGSSLVQSQVIWNFDCDPENRIQRTAAEPTPVAGAISWNWDWDRPGLADWSWRRDELIPIATCPLCTYMFDFKWLSFEPATPAAPVSVAVTPSSTAPFAVTQVNSASASATASVTSEIDQLLTQSRTGTSEAEQQALQQAQVVQAAEAQAGAELIDAVNFSVDTGGVVAQTNLAQSEAEALITSTILQQVAQQLNGEDSFQAQLALQSATTTQEIFSAGTATLVKNANVGVSVGGTSTQSASSVASARGVEVATTRQTVEQEQEGAGSDQEQIAGQWAVVAQQFELLAGAALADTRNESTLKGEASNLRLESEAAAAGSSAGTIDQLAIQLQSGDSTALQQESFQQATIEQDGIGLAAATAGGTRLIYRTPPPAQPFMAVPETIASLAASAEPVAGTEAALAEPVLLALPQITAVQAAPLRRAVLPKVAAAKLVEPRGSAPDELQRPVATQAPVERAAAARAPFAVPLSNEILASTAGNAGSVPSMTEDAEKAAAASSGPHCLAPISGASAATAGTGSGNAFCALSGYVLSPEPRLGRRIFAPAGRRPAAVVLLQARPG